MESSILREIRSLNGKKEEGARTDVRVNAE
jgi:hypothetical protein